MNNRKYIPTVLIICSVISATIFVFLLAFFLPINRNTLTKNEIDTALGLYIVPYDLDTPQTIFTDGPLKIHSAALVESSIEYFEKGQVPLANSKIVIITNDSKDSGALILDADYSPPSSSGRRLSPTRRGCQAVIYKRTDSNLELKWKIWNGVKDYRCPDHYIDNDIVLKV